MKVGVLTFRWAYNYGALLQAYALRKVITALGAEVEFINYVLPTHRQPPFRGMGLRSSRWRLPLVLRFEMFRHHHLPATQAVYNHKDLEPLSKSYDAVVVGSDQVWSSRVHDGFFPAYFLDFVKSSKTRRISYGACFGQRDQASEALQKAGDLLSRFDHLSVRNQMSQELVRQLSGRESRVVQDPTLLYGFDEFFSTRQSKGDYILVYSLASHHRTLGETIVKRLREKTRLPVVSVWPGMEFCEADRIVRAVGPIQWLRLFKNARFICTDSFHGTVFATKFKKPFASWAGSRPERLRDFLASVGLDDRLVTNIDTIDFGSLAEPIDYDEVFRNLQPLIGSSRQFLSQALSDRSSRGFSA
jgi:hypothetical protein